MPEDDFGKDLGLVHQVVLVGRSVGADRNFWASLAHTSGLLEDVVEFVSQWMAVTDEDKKAIMAWLHLFDPDNPLQEEESYYFRTSHCGIYKISNECHEKVPALDAFINKVSRNKRAREILGQMHCFFIMFYLYSGLWAYKNRKEVEWMHSPLWSTFHNLMDVVAGHSPDSHTRWHFDYHKTFMANPNFLAMRDQFYKYATDWTQSHSVEERLTNEQIDELIAICRSKVIQQKNLVDRITWYDPS